VGVKEQEGKKKKYNAKLKKEKRGSEILPFCELRKESNSRNKARKHSSSVKKGGPGERKESIRRVGISPKGTLSVSMNEIRTEKK